MARVRVGAQCEECLNERRINDSEMWLHVECTGGISMGKES